MMHKHQCDRCGLVWAHGEDCQGDKPSHTCARCGRLEWWQYRGSAPPDHVNFRGET
jgi:rubredoxin